VEDGFAWCRGRENDVYCFTRFWCVGRKSEVRRKRRKKKVK
jgi:hypothetical protein